MNNIDVWNDLGNLYLKANAIDAAIDAYNKAIDQGYQTVDIYKNLAGAYLSQGNIRDSISLFQKSIELLSSKYEKAVIFSQMGDCYRRLEDFDNAIAAYRSAIELEPGNPELCVGLNDVQQDLEKFYGFDKNYDISEGEKLVFTTEEANNRIVKEGIKSQVSSQEMKEDPILFDMDLLPEEITTKLNVGKLDDAVLPEESLESIFNMGKQSTSMDSSFNLTSFVPPFVEEDDNPEIIYPVINTQNLNENTEEQPSFGHETNIESDNKDTDLTRDQIPDVVGNLEREKEDGVRATLLLTLGIMHWRNGSLEEADKMLQSAIKVSVQIKNRWFEALSWHAIALVKTALGDVIGAIEAYLRAVELAPNQIFPWNNIGNLYGSLGHNDEAMASFQKAIKQNPDDSKSWDGLGDIYTKLGRLDDAIAAYQLGNVFDSRIQGSDAIKAYEKAFDFYQLTIASFENEISNLQNDVPLEEEVSNQESLALDKPSLASDTFFDLVDDNLGVGNDKESNLTENTSDHAQELLQGFSQENQDLSDQVDIDRVNTEISELNSINRLAQSKNILDESAIEITNRVDPSRQDSPDAKNSFEIVRGEIETNTTADPKPVISEIEDKRSSIKESREISEAETGLHVVDDYDIHSNSNNKINELLTGQSVHSDEELIAPADDCRLTSSDRDFQEGGYQSKRDFKECMDSDSGNSEVEVVENNGNEINVEQFEPGLASVDNPSLRFNKNDSLNPDDGNQPKSKQSLNDVVKEVIEEPAVSLDDGFLPMIPPEKSPKREGDRVALTIASYEAVVRENPKNDRAWDSLGNLYRITQRNSDAIHAFECAVALEPTKYVYHYQLGTLHASEGNYPEAIREIQKVVELNPGFIFAHCALASYLRRIGKDDDAQKHIEIALPHMKDEKEYDRACFESIRGNTNEALDLLAIALEKKQTTLEWIERDQDLDFVRNNARYQQLMTKSPRSVVDY